MLRHRYGDQSQVQACLLCRSDQTPPNFHGHKPSLPTPRIFPPLRLHHLILMRSQPKARTGSVILLRKAPFCEFVLMYSLICSLRSMLARAPCHGVDNVTFEEPILAIADAVVPDFGEGIVSELAEDMSLIAQRKASRMIASRARGWRSGRFQWCNSLR